MSNETRELVQELLDHVAWFRGGSWSREEYDALCTRARSYLAEFRTPPSGETPDARDAARYRWMRDNIVPWGLNQVRFPCVEVDVFLRKLTNGGVEMMSIIGKDAHVGIASLDQAIDAAMSEASPDA